MLANGTSGHYRNVLLCRPFELAVWVTQDAKEINMHHMYNRPPQGINIVVILAALKLISWLPDLMSFMSSITCMAVAWLWLSLALPYSEKQNANGK